MRVFEKDLLLLIDNVRFWMVSVSLQGALCKEMQRKRNSKKTIVSADKT